MGRRTRGPICGNGIVENGEDCDCGLDKSCISVEACCNPRTCRFYPGAQCLSGTCCSGCKVLPAGYSCRSSQNSCDVPEVCDGLSSQCPEDDHLMDGTTCPRHGGTCFHGECINAQQQCVDLWGQGANVAHESCYTNFNPTGSMTGHCGYDSRLHKYIPCFDHDAKCGLLHCQGGLSYPRIASSNFMIFHVNTREGSFECKSVSSPMHSVLVNDGAVCGEKHVCQNNTCVQYSISSSCQPEKTCSGNGVCTTNGFCSCYPNWKGNDCSIFDYQTPSIKSHNRSLPLGTDSISPTAFASLTTITFLMVILCMIISCLFKHKKSRSIHRKARESTVTSNNRLTQAQITINPQDLPPDRSTVVPSINQIESNLISSPMSMHRTTLMASNRSITSACTGLSYLAGDTPRSVRHSNRKTSSNGIFSDSETPRTRSRRPVRHIGSPYLQSRHQHSYATLTLKRPETSVRYETSRKIYDDIDKLSTNENLRDFIQVLDCLAQEKFGSIEMKTRHFEKDSTAASSPTETNESITLDSGYQSTKQLMHNDEYAVIMKNKQVDRTFSQRRRSFSSIDHDEAVQEKSF